MSEIKLLPCPFCGGEALECKTKVICSKCTCTVYGRNIDIARKLWNTRKPLERIIEKLENLRAKPTETVYDTVLIGSVIEIVKEVGGIE